MPPPASRAVGTLLVAALLVLAGCGGFLGSDDVKPSDGADVTPAPVPNATGVPGAAVSNGSVPPDRHRWLTDGQFVDAGLIRERHYAALANRSYTVEVVRAGNRTPGGRRTTLRVRNGSTFHLVGGRNRTSLLYSDPDGYFERNVEKTGHGYVAGDGMRAAPPRSEPPRFEFWRHFDSEPSSVERVRRNGRLYYRIRQSDSRGADSDSRHSNVTVLLGADGVVRSIDVTGNWYDPYEEAWVHVDLRVSVSNVGSTTVTEPSWVASAKRRGPTTKPDGFPQGLDEDGLTGSGALFDAHRFVLHEESFTLVRSSNRSWTWRLPPPGRIAVANESTYLRRLTGGPPVYVDPTGRYERPSGERNGDRDANSTGDSSGVRVGDPEEWEWYDRASGLWWLRAVAERSNVTRVLHGGVPFFRVTRRIRESRYHMDAENVTVTALVRPDGLVRRITVEARVPVDGSAGPTATGGDRWREVTYRFEYRNVGSTTVTEPAWVRTAKRNRTATPAGAVDPPSTVPVPER